MFWPITFDEQVPERAALLVGQEADQVAARKWKQPLGDIEIWPAAKVLLQFVSWMQLTLL
jgi:hypothetical protein